MIAGEQHRASVPSRRSCRTASAEVGFTVSATAIIPRPRRPNRPAPPTVTLRAAPARSPPIRNSALTSSSLGLQQRLCPTQITSAARRPRRPRRSRAGSRSVATSGSGPAARACCGDRPGDRVLRAGFGGTPAARTVPLVDARLGSHRNHLIRPSVTVPVLSSTTVSIRRTMLQHLRALDQDAQLRSPPGADQQRGRRGQPERTGTGDDQHRPPRR